MGKSGTDVTALLHAVERGDQGAYEDLIGRVYSELHRLARRYLRRERADHTLQPTALVHEAFLRLVHQSDARWKNRAQFFAVASQAMRRVLVDHARGRATSKRGGDAVRVSIDAGEGREMAGEAATDPAAVDLIDLDRALDDLARIDAELVRLVELRYFGGLTIPETAEALGMSAASVKRSWVTARAWLFERLGGGA